MPRVSKPILWWSSDIDGSVMLSAAPVNKAVWLHGLNVRQHTPFQIRRRNLLARIPRLGRRLFGSWVGDLRTLYTSDGRMRSEISWQTAHVSPVPSSTDYYFIDGNSGVSGPLAVSNTPTTRFESFIQGGMGLHPRLETGLSANPLGANYVRAELGRLHREYEFTIVGEVLAPIDPDVEVEILEPGTSGDLLLETALEILYYESENLPFNNSQPFVVSALRHINTFLGRRYVEFSIGGESRFTATPDDPTSISITLRGDGPVRLLFAIRVRDRETGEASISEFMPVIVTQAR